MHQNGVILNQGHSYFTILEKLSVIAKLLNSLARPEVCDNKEDRAAPVGSPPDATRVAKVAEVGLVGSRGVLKKLFNARVNPSELVLICSCLYSWPAKNSNVWQSEGVDEEVSPSAAE